VEGVKFGYKSKEISTVRKKFEMELGEIQEGNNSKLQCSFVRNVAV
jgi:hypothetical protein